MTIRDGDGTSRSKVIDELIRIDSLDSEVLRTLLEAIQAGKCVTTGTLADVVAKTQSAELYWHVKDQLTSDPSTCIELLKCDYPDPEIESLILERLYKEAGKIGNPLRSYAVDALAEHGSLRSLRVLAEILEEQVPLAKAKEFVAKAIAGACADVDFSTLMRSLEASAQNEFVEKVACAIKRIGERGKTSFPMNSFRIVQEEANARELPPVDKDVVAQVLEHKARAWYYLKKDTKASLQIRASKC